MSGNPSQMPPSNGIHTSAPSSSFTNSINSSERQNTSFGYNQEHEQIDDEGSEDDGDDDESDDDDDDKPAMKKKSEKAKWSPDEVGEILLKS